MRRSLLIVLVLCCCAALHLICFFPVLFQDRQFGFRDAAHYYYPLYQRVQTEWDAGRWPLWEPEENAGMPLLGNPTAAVLYPGKLIYAALPYPWAARTYVIAHVMLACAAMLILMRSWATSWAGSGLAAIAYAFGVPVLFQNCNIIYLVGAAWLPLGFHAVDRWARRGLRWGLIELAVVLAMQTLGGDPQSSYLLGLSALGYSAGLAWRGGRGNGGLEVSEPREQDAPLSKSRGLKRWWRLPLWFVVVAVWIGLTLALARWLPTLRPGGFPPPPLPWMRHVPTVVAGLWMAAGAAFCWTSKRRGWNVPLIVASSGLLGSALLAVALSSAQLLPVLEFIRATSRATGEGLHDIYPFSIEPLRLVLWFWPNVLGGSTGVNTFWGDLARLPGQYPKPWVTSFYAGCLVFVLAIGAWGRRRAAPWRAWMSIVLVVSLVGALGKYTSPIWGARVLAEMTGQPRLRALVADLGGLDPEESSPIRHDGHLRDGDGSFYWWMATLLPGFRQFRYPAKLFTFTSLALAALAGAGWDDLLAGRRRRTATIGFVLLALSLVLLAGAWLERGAILAVFRGTSAVGLYGPFDPRGAHAAILMGLAQSAIVLSAGLAAVRLARSRPQAASAIVLLIATADIATANARHVVTVPQSVFETVPEAARIIAEAERAHPAPGPYRVHRMAIWDPFWWATTSSPDRAREINVWERDTLQPKYGINFGVEYVHTFGVAELYDYDWYFGPFYRSVRDGQIARVLNVKLGDRVVYFPRRSFNMWNARYFIVPMLPNGWKEEIRGFASFLLHTQRIYPKPDDGPGGAVDADAQKDWAYRHDYQILRNLAEHPRAWVVHQARALDPLEGLGKEERKLAMQEITYADDPIWHDPTMQPFDPLQLAWVEGPDLTALARYVGGGPMGRSEPVKIACPGPQRVELDVDLKAPGIVVLADVFYPGWKLTIDDEPAPIYRVNRLMRGAAVPANKHHLVYTYDPGSFRIGRAVSLAGIGLLGLLSVFCAFRPASPVAGAWPKAETAALPPDRPVPSSEGASSDD